MIKQAWLGKIHTYLLDRQLVAGAPTTFMIRGKKKACVLATRPSTRDV